jgi:hypothetical protein
MYATSAALLLTATMAAGACVDAEPWHATIGPRAVECCARHGLHALGRADDIDDVTLWCPGVARHSLTIHAFVNWDVTPNVPFGPDGWSAACRVGPRFHRPVSLKPHQTVQRRCCDIVVAQVTGDFVPVVGSAHTYFTGRITSATGDIHCGQRTIPFTTWTAAPHGNSPWPGTALP